MSYAVWWIRQGILSALARQAGTISYPPDRMHKALRLRRLENRLAQRLGRSPDRDELGAELGGSAVSAAGIVAVLDGMASTRGLGGVLLSSDDLAQPDDGEGPEAAADLDLIRKALKRRMDGLSERERRVLSLRFGLGHGIGFSLSEVGSMLGMTRERVRQIEGRALAHLKRSTRSLRP
jgi:RNA polymerase primary sigma factor